MIFRHSYFVRVSLSALALAAASAAPALAQEAEGSAAEDAGDIVVTANRTASLASKTPIALTAVTGEGLRAAGITNPTTLADQVPSLSIDRAIGLQITIRGVTSTDGTEKGDPSAAFLLDGIYIARPQAQEVSFYDIDRVEVLRGPQGTLYGRNTTAGLVNVISAKPQFDFGASFDGTYGNFDTVQATGMINVPVNEVIALRAAVNYDRRDNFIRQGSSPYSLDPFKDNLSGRLSALVNFTDNIDLLVRADYSQQKGAATGTVMASNFFQTPFAAPTAGNRGTDPLYVGGLSSKERRTLGYSEATQSSRDNDTWGVMAELNWRFSDALTLTYLGSYREMTRDESVPTMSGVVTAISLPISVPATFTGNYWQNSQELRLAYADDRLKAQVGAYYFKEHSAIEFLLFGVISPTPGARGYVFGFPQDPTISKSVAFFGQATYSLTDSLRVTGGIRYTKDDKSRVGATIFHGSVDDPLDFSSPVLPDSLNNASRSFKKTTWKAGLDYDLNSRTLLYGSVATGYKAGGFNDGCSAGATNCNSPLPDEALYYDPETLTAYEVGFKTRISGNALRLNGNYFHYEYKGLQLSQLSQICGGPCQVTTNAASAKIDGVELEGVIAPDERNQVDFSLAWLNARFSDYEIAPGVSFADEKLSRSPEWVVTAGYTYTYPLANGGTIAAAVRTKVSDSYYLLSTAIRAQFRQPGYTRTDLSLTYTAPEDRWYLQAFAKNLENDIVVTNVAVVPAFPGLNDGTATFADPRTYGVRAGFKF